MQQTALKEKEVNPQEMQGEFVVGGNVYASAVRSLDSVDYYEQGLTPETQRRMRFDSEVESSVEFLIDSVFSDGIAPVSCVTDENDADFSEAQEIAAFVREAVSDPVRSIETVAREMFRDCYFSGAKAGEIVLRLKNGDYILDRINPKPNAAVGFVCDKFFNVLGLVGAQTNGYVPTVVKSEDEIIPREKFLIFQFELENNDPRGVKKIRSAFDAWCDKKDTRPQYKEWRKTSAIPKKFGTTPQNSKDIPVRNPDGTQKIVNGVPQTITAEKGLMNALEGFANNSTVVGPNGTTVTQLEVKGTGQQFITAFKFNNSEIRKSILGDSLATGEADKDARAAKQIAVTVVDLRVRSFRNIVAAAIKKDVFRLLAVMKFGEEKAHLTPDCSLGDTERRDWEKTADALAGIGYQMADEHQREGDIILGFTPREKQAQATDEGDGGGGETQ